MKLDLNKLRLLASRSRKQNYTLPENNVKEKYIRQNFNAIAAKYDLFNDAITFGRHRHWKKQCVRALKLGQKKPARVIDLCCGSGDLTLILARYLAKNSHITAIDFSEAMLAILRQRLANNSFPEKKIEILEGNIMQMDFSTDNNFDGAVIGFGLRNVLNRKECLTEIRRILKPGAALAILDVGRVSLPLISSLHSLYFERITPLIGSLIHGKKHEMYDYLPASAKNYPAQQELVAELEEVGFRNVTYQNFMLGASALHVAWK